MHPKLKGDESRNTPFVYLKWSCADTFDAYVMIRITLERFCVTINRLVDVRRVYTSMTHDRFHPEEINIVPDTVSLMTHRKRRLIRPRSKAC